MFHKYIYILTKQVIYIIMVYMPKIIEDSIWCKMLSSTPGEIHFGMCAWNILYVTDVYRLKLCIIDWCKSELNMIPRIDVTYDSAGEGLVAVHCLYIYFENDTDAMAFKICWENV